MTSEHPTGYWKQAGQHNFRIDAFGIQVWIRFRHSDRETRLYGDVFKRKGDPTPTCHECGYELGEDWKHRDKHAKKRGEHPADCPNCGGNPLPPVGGA